MPRPRKEEPRERYTLRLLKTELEQIQTKADQAALTVSEYLRRCALGKRIRSRVSDKAIAELNRLGGLQKHCLAELKQNESNRAVREELNRTLFAIRAELKSVIATGLEEE
jgi:hypothetical protein